MENSTENNCFCKHLEYRRNWVIKCSMFSPLDTANQVTFGKMISNTTARQRAEII